MAKRVSIAVCLSLGAAFALGAGCTSIPDHRKTLPADFHEVDGGNDASAADGGVGGKPGTGGKGNGGGGAATGGASTEGGAGGGSQEGGDGTIACGGSVDAGGVSCRSLSTGRNTFPACCAGLTQSRCGLESDALGIPGCLELNQEGNPSPDCADLKKGSDTLAGCCRADATCGVVYRISGNGPNFGCVDPTLLGFPEGGSCTPSTTNCAAPGEGCSLNADCCAGGSYGPVCVTFYGEATSQCSTFCNSNLECASGCCAILTSGRGACAPDPSTCGNGCRVVGATCDSDDDCCSGAVCAPNSDAGPRVCRPSCNSNADCSPTAGADRSLCIPTEDGASGFCTDKGAALCTDTCLDNSDGSCDDGGPGSSNTYCALGSDCTDCAPQSLGGVRLGGMELCDDSCASAGNQVCEDGGTLATDTSCGWGTDCTDCGPRLGICSNYCEYANDGYCDDGGPGAYDAVCATGTDCGDCGVRFGGRGENACDGTLGTVCNPNGATWIPSWVGDGYCDCSDCAWDSGPNDCNLNATLCDGQALGACCAPGDPCNYKANGFCECGGWCDWEPNDCGMAEAGSRCDGSLSEACSFYAGGQPDGVCDCQGVCSFEGSDCDSLGLACLDTCNGFTADGYCEDGGDGSVSSICTLGTDCADCGARGGP